MKERLILAVLYLLLLTIAAEAGHLVADFVIRGLNTIVVLEQTHTASVIRVFLSMILSGAVLAVVSYWEGYHFASFDKGVVFPAIAIAQVAHFGIGFILGFWKWVSGGIIYLACWLNYGASYTSESSTSTKDIRLWCIVAAVLVYAAVYTFCMSFPQYYGALKRYADREELLEERQKKSTYVQPAQEYFKAENSETNQHKED